MKFGELRSRLERDGPGTRAGDGRAISQVVAVVLLLGSTVLLAAVAGPLVFDTIRNVGNDTPEAQLAFLYEQGGPLDADSTTDDFDTQFEQGDGTVTIQFRNGDTLDPANVEIRGSVSGGNLLDDTPTDVVAQGEMVRDGATFTVTADRNETISVIWSDDAGEESAVLGSFTPAAPAQSTGPWVPDPDAQCEYIETQLDSGATHIKILGTVVECDFTQYYPEITDITIKSEDGDFGAVVGEVNGTGDINIDNGGTFQGNLESGTGGSNGDINIKNGSSVYSDVVAKGSGYVDIDGGSKVAGSVDAVQGVSLQSSSSVSGDIVSGTDGNGDVDVTNSRVGGGITTNGNGSGNVDIDQYSTVGGPIDAMGTVDVQVGSLVKGPIRSGTDGSDGKVKLTSSDVRGDITVEGSDGVDVLNESNVDGDIETPGHVTVKGNSSAAGDIVSGTDGSGGKVKLVESGVGGGIRVEGTSDIDLTSSTVGGAVNSTEGNIYLDQSTAEGALTSISEQTITIQGSSTVEGSLTAVGNGTLKILSGSTVGGPIDAERCVNVEGGSSVAGGITMGTYASDGNDCTTVDSSTVGGPITADGPAKLAALSSTIEGLFSPHPQSLFECDNSTFDGKNCSEVEVPEFAFNITSMDTAVSKGDSLTVDLTVTNVGFGGTKDLPLYINGSQELTKSISLSRNEENNDVQFQWDTSGTDRGVYNLTIASDIESASHTVYVAGSSSAAWEVESVDSAEDVLAGKNLSVTAKIRNNGGSQGTTTVELLDFDGRTVDTEDVTVQSDDSENVTLEWNTSSGNLGTGNYTVDTVNGSGTRSVELLENVYELQDVALYESGKNLDVELFLDLSNNATADIEVFDENGDSMETTTVDAMSEVYTVLKNDNLNSFNGSVTVRLYDRDGDKRGEETVDWTG
jgi:hypothetical protein